MLEEKRKDLESEQQKRIIMQLVQELSQTHPDFYYHSAAVIARLLKDYMDSNSEFWRNAKLFKEERDVMKRMSQKDIEVVLSHSLGCTLPKN